jgi:hypothetical protein
VFLPQPESNCNWLPLCSGADKVVICITQEAARGADRAPGGSYFSTNYSQNKFRNLCSRLTKSLEKLIVVELVK